MQINLDPFFNRTTPLAKQKKLLGYVFQEPWRNEKTISTLGTYLPQKQAEAKEAWEAANRKMLNEVKRCKTNFERWGKIIAHYEMLKTKNHF